MSEPTNEDVEIVDRTETEAILVSFESGDEYLRIDLPHLADRDIDQSAVWVSPSGWKPLTSAQEILEEIFQGAAASSPDGDVGEEFLKPCPLCTSGAVHASRHQKGAGGKTHTMFSITCGQCGVNLTDPNKSILRRKWNTRPGEPSDGAFDGKGLFEGRTAHAAATQLSQVLAFATECELATLSRYERLKSSSKKETERHQNIAKRLVRHCEELNVSPEGVKGKCPRLKKRLESD